MQTQEEMNVLVPKKLAEIKPIKSIQDYILANIQELDAYVQSVTNVKRDWKILNQFSLKNQEKTEVIYG